MKNKKWTAIILYGLLFGYVLSFIFEGRVYYQIVAGMNYDYSGQHLIAMFSHMVGLLCAATFVKKHEIAKNIMRITIGLCMVLTPVFLVPNSVCGYLVLSVVSFLSGISVACWGSFYKFYIFEKDRFKSMAETLILANVLMIFSGLIATYISAIVGFIIVLLYLVIALYILCTVCKTNDVEKRDEEKTISENIFTNKALALFVAFIIIITIDSGLMYGVINTAYQSLDTFVSWYWAVPYIVVLFLMGNVSSKRGTRYLYLANFMIMIGFVFYMFLDVSVRSFLIIDTLLLGAAGILDLFWSTIVGESFESFNYPVKILGVGWAANVFGVFVGGLISQYILLAKLDKSVVTVVALVIIIFSLAGLPEMLRSLRMMLKNNIYLSSFLECEEDKKVKITKKEEIEVELTAREAELLKLILEGKSNKQITEELCISESTVKTHVRNILGKYEVNNRTQLISKILTKAAD